MGRLAILAVNWAQYGPYGRSLHLRFPLLKPKEKALST